MWEKIFRRFPPVFWVLVWMVLQWWILDLFFDFDWNDGLVRGGLLILLLATHYAGLFFIQKEWHLVKRGVVWAWGLLSMIFLYGCFMWHLSAASRAIQNSSHTHQVRLDQGQSNYAALEGMLKGINPYASTSVFDEYVYMACLQKLKNQPAFRDCYNSDSIVGLDEKFKQYWKSTQREGQFNPALMKTLMPEFVTTNTSESCHEIRECFATAGLKYGPTMLVSYWPWVKSFDIAGIYIAHLIYFLLLIFLFYRVLFRKFSKLDLFLATLPFYFLLYTSHFIHNTLFYSACDLFPVLTAVAFVLLRNTRYSYSAAFFLGASISAKLFPGILYLPVLLTVENRRRRMTLITLTSVIAFYLPFVLQDWDGFITQIFLFNFNRPYDSTSVGYFLSLPLNALLGLLVAAAITFSFHKMTQKKTEASVAFYLLVAHVGTLLMAKAFHNNYLVWILPLLGLSAHTPVEKLARNPMPMGE